MVVFQVVGQLHWRFNRAFMIAAEQNKVDVSEPQTRFELLLHGQDRRVWLREEQRQPQAQRNSVSFGQSEWSNLPSLRATAVLACLAPFLREMVLPHFWSANGRFTRDKTILAASLSALRSIGSPALNV